MISKKMSTCFMDHSCCVIFKNPTSLLSSRDARNKIIVQIFCTQVPNHSPPCLTKTHWHGEKTVRHFFPYLSFQCETPAGPPAELKVAAEKFVVGFKSLTKDNRNKFSQSIYTSTGTAQTAPAAAFPLNMDISMACVSSLSTYGWTIED